MKIFIFAAGLLVIFLGLLLDVHAVYDDKQIQNYKKEFESCNQTMQQQKDKMSKEDLEKETWKCSLKKIGAVEENKIRVEKMIRICTWAMNSTCKEDICYQITVKCTCDAQQGKTDEEKFDILVTCSLRKGLAKLLTEKTEL